MDVTVQLVQTWWTKASRGGAAAARRNRVPVAYPLPTGERIHVVVHREAGGFAPVHETRVPDDARLAELTLNRDGDRLRVVSQRHRLPAVRLQPGQWLRWQVNHRFVGLCGGEWHYRLDTFNVAFGPVGSDVFLGEPTRRIDERASLL